jgi:hypothetical protein
MAPTPPELKFELGPENIGVLVKLNDSQRN